MLKREISERGRSTLNSTGVNARKDSVKLGKIRFGIKLGDRPARQFDRDCEAADFRERRVHASSMPFDRLPRNR